MILGIDPGNHRVKVCGSFGVLDFSAALGEWRDRRMKQSFGYDDMEFEIDGRLGFAGTLAEMESDWGKTRKGDSKAHEDAKIRVLLALHRYAHEDSYRIVVGQPIGGFFPAEKDKIKSMLIGHHQTTVNGVSRHFRIERVEVCPEGATAALASPQEGMRRVIEIGSGTVNFATVIGARDGNGKLRVKYVDRDSWSVARGMENTASSHADMARGIANEALQRWKQTDSIDIAGCAAEMMQQHLAKFFHSSRILRPTVAFKNGDEPHLPLCAYANAVGFYEIAKGIYHA